MAHKDTIMELIETVRVGDYDRFLAIQLAAPERRAGLYDGPVTMMTGALDAELVPEAASQRGQVLRPLRSACRDAGRTTVGPDGVERAP